MPLYSKFSIERMVQTAAMLKKINMSGKAFMIFPILNALFASILLISFWRYISYGIPENDDPFGIYVLILLLIAYFGFCVFIFVFKNKRTQLLISLAIIFLSVLWNVALFARIKLEEKSRNDNKAQTQAYENQKKIEYPKEEVKIRNNERKENVRKIYNAVEVYYSKFGKYPQTLEDVVKSGILTSLPQDKFKNQPINLMHQFDYLYRVGELFGPNEANKSNFYACIFQEPLTINYTYCNRYCLYNFPDKSTAQVNEGICLDSPRPIN